MWDQNAQRLWWVDIDGQKLCCLDQDGSEGSITFDERVGFVAPIDERRVYVGAEKGLYVVDWAARSQDLYIATPHSKVAKRFNDACVDPAGRLWMGDMAMGPGAAPDGRFYRLEPDGTLFEWQAGFGTTNGLAFSPAGDRMYFSDSQRAAQKIWVCDYDLATGTPSHQRVFVDVAPLAGRPDGGAVDCDGTYWMAGVGDWVLHRFDPDGQLMQTIEVPVEYPTKIAFGGAHLDEIFLTSFGKNLSPGSEGGQPNAGRVLKLSGLGVRGFCPPRANPPLAARP